MSKYQELQNIAPEAGLTAEEARPSQIAEKRFVQTKAAFREYQTGELVKRFDNLCTDHDVLGNYLAQKLNLDPSFISVARRREYRLPLSATAVIAKDVFHMSVHEFLWAEKPQPILLPKNLSLVAEKVEGMSSAQVKNLINWVMMDSQKDFLNAPAIQDKHLPVTAITEYRDIIRSRIEELKVDAWVSEKEAMGKASCKSITQYLLSELANETPSNASSFTFSIIYLSIWRNIPVDYFVCADYAQYCPIAYLSVQKERNGKESQKPVTVTSDAAIRLVSMLLNMPEPQKAFVISKILTRF